MHQHSHPSAFIQCASWTGNQPVKGQTETATHTTATLESSVNLESTLNLNPWPSWNEAWILATARLHRNGQFYYTMRSVFQHPSQSQNSQASFDQHLAKNKSASDNLASRFVFFAGVTQQVISTYIWGASSVYTAATEFSNSGSLPQWDNWKKKLFWLDKA